MNASSEPILTLAPRTNVKRYLFLLIVLGLSLYFLLSEFARIQHALQVASTLRIRFIALALGAQMLSYLGGGFLLRAVVGPVAKPVSIADGGLVSPSCRISSTGKRSHVAGNEPNPAVVSYDVRHASIGLNAGQEKGELGVSRRCR